ncbi:CCE_0567 family metalloprotein [Paenibacillus zanthoxyli]|uniref:CCE_0567 family metalloprotein n=1 Tax=Paenibacillus zanthoxyli TaxID=369399 RepID=UPI0004723B16|nr:CCE_0567 family metalloprotein [Paenibacillus zanthoxyli]
MEQIDKLKEEIKELNSAAISLQNQLHDLAEGLPMHLEELPELARRTFETFSELTAKRQELKSLKSQQV